MVYTTVCENDIYRARRRGYVQRNRIVSFDIHYILYVVPECVVLCLSFFLTTDSSSILFFSVVFFLFRQERLHYFVIQTICLDIYFALYIFIFFFFSLFYTLGLSGCNPTFAIRRNDYNVYSVPRIT